MRRAGFTMIELVFIIVILGVLASVAIPKLVATRDDANIVKASSELSAIITSIGSYYTVHNRFDSNISKMTNTKFTKNDGTTPDEHIALDGTLSLFYSDIKRKDACLEFKITDKNEGNLTISRVATATSVFCKGLFNASSELIKTHKLGGSSIF